MAIPGWFAPSMISVVFSGVTTFLPKLTLRTLKLLDLIVYHAFFFLIAAIVLQLFYFGLEFEPRGVIIAMATGVIGTLGQVLYLVALRNGPVTHISMISSLYPLIATVFAFEFLHEPLTLRQVCGILLGLCAITLLVVAHDD